MFSWQFSNERSRPKRWYLYAMVIVLFLVVYGIIEGMYLMSVVAILFTGVYVMMENNASPITSVTITSDAITINKTVYEMGKIDRFGFLYNEGVAVMLRIFPKKSLPSSVDIALTEAVDVEGLRDFLAGHITYDSDINWKGYDRMIHAMKL